MLKIGPAGLPSCLKKGDYRHAVAMLRNELDLDAIEVEFVYGARMKPEIAVELGQIARRHDVALTVHAPYYINLNSVEKAKRDRSRNHIISSARLADSMQARSVTFHAAFNLGMKPDDVFKAVHSEINMILSELSAEGISVSLRPELTGKPSQWGSLEELVRLAEAIPEVSFCIDFAHLHARTGGKYNSYAEFASVLDFISKRLGDSVLKNMHLHVAGINFGKAGERNHLAFSESSFNYSELLKALYDYRVTGSLICESPILEQDAIILARAYRSLSKER